MAAEIAARCKSHPRGGGDPVTFCIAWIPAIAGMTKYDFFRGSSASRLAEEHDAVRVGPEPVICDAPDVGGLGEVLR